MQVPKPVVLCILDGWGLSDVTEANAPLLADTPVFDKLMQTCPNNTLVTHGPDVGLPSGQMGNSEVGHTNIGAGRVVAMDLGQIDLAIEDGSFGTAEAIQAFIRDMKASGGTAHLMGIISDGGVHGHINHIVAAAKVLSEAEIPVVLHALTDGRDVAPKSALTYLGQLAEALPEGVQIATLSGRYFAMDRDNRWARVREAYEAMIFAKGPRSDTPEIAVKNAYARSETDEFISATIIGDYQGAQDGDGFFCLNFRADRAREIMRAVAQPGFNDFPAGPRPSWAAMLGMVEYSRDHNVWVDTVFPSRDIGNTLAEWVSKHDKTQFHLAETEKYPHVTFFLNGGKEDPEPGEDRYMAPSPQVATYDMQPEMSADEVTTHFISAIDEGYDLIVVNYANPDMVGHTGDLAAAMTACEAVDQGLARVVDALAEAGGAMIITADHGNCETMIDPETGGPHTAHTTNPVPVILVGGPGGAKLSSGRLCDLAPTLLELMQLPQPGEMTGKSLIQ
ncbi:2,3-bisphosphoglycerate-independent phosphoglycerate mutase [Roseovarius sp. 2305UL8-3]|uniref:2,3-bisphosphoglycerate-independent phosphoglycerate mutase n=1 Tax=Roseovarius conchicola TaxID=3121636 RepID=UPI003526E4C1